MLRIIRLVLISSLLSFSALGWLGTVERAHAATIVASHTSPIDFGNVAIGSSVDVLFTTQFSFADGEILSSSFVIGDNTFGDFTIDRLNPAGSCNDPGFICNWNLSFAPIAVGFQNSGPWPFLRIIPFQGISDEVFLSFQGTGVAAVPLPAALPLLGTGLAVKGFIGWHRRRKAVAA